MKKKYKYFLWLDKEKGIGEGETLYYILANNWLAARNVLRKTLNFNYDPHFIDGDVKEIDEIPKDTKLPVL